MSLTAALCLLVASQIPPVLAAPRTLSLAPQAPRLEASAGPSISEFTIPTAASGPGAISAGPDGNLWFTEDGSNKIGKITTGGTFTEYPIPTSSGGPPGDAITAGPDGNIWFTEAWGNNIGKVTTGGAFTEYPIPTSSSNPEGIAAGRDGNLWFTEYFGNNIGKITIGGAVTEYPLPTTSSNPAGIAAGPDGNLWFTELIANKIGRITTRGALTEYPLPTSSSNPAGIAAGPDGNLWFTEEGGNKIGKITTSGAITEYLIPTGFSHPAGIAAGPEGNLWFTELTGNNIAKITTGGAITEYAVPTSSSNPGGVATGPDGNLWFTEQTANKIGEIKVPWHLSTTLAKKFIGTVTNIKSAAPAADLMAQMSWGDGVVTTAALRQLPNQMVAVSASHTYYRLPSPSANTYSAFVLVTDTAGVSQSYPGTVTVQAHYLGLGDSYSAGEGANYPILAGCDYPLYRDHAGYLFGISTDHVNGSVLFGTNCSHQSSRSYANVCHRSITAYDHYVNELLSIGGLSLSLSTVACSGAVADDVFIPFDSNPAHGTPLPQSHQGEVGQAALVPHDTALITLGFGGNDLKFADNAQTCIANDITPIDSNSSACLKADPSVLTALGYDTSPGGSGDGTFHFSNFMGADQPPTNPIALGASNPSALDLYRQKLNLHDTLVWIFRSLKKQAPAAKIVAVGYPRWFQSGGHGSDCEHFTEMDQTFINDRIALLDNIIQDAANESGVASYADVYNAFSGREECTGDPRHYLVDPSNGNLICYSDSQDINGVDLVQGVAKSPELLHPSPCGHITESQIVAPEFSAPNPNEIAQFSLLPGELRSTSITAPSSGDTRRMDISTTWTAAGVQTTLIGASGAVTPSVQGPTYAVWTILDPPPSSTWSLQISAPIATVNAGSSTIAINQTSSSVFLLGPASVVNGPTCANGSCTFTATVNTKVQPLVSTYDWYDEHANYLGSGSSISMAQEPSPQVGTLILKTSSIYGGDSYRYTTFDYALPCFGC